MRLFLQQSLPAPPEVVWTYVTDPELMNRWSKAFIRLVALGDGYTPCGVGTMREVELRALRQTLLLREVIQESERPHRFVYRVVDVPFIRAHRGEVRIKSDGDARSELTWEVDAELFPALAGLSAKRLLESELKKSLRTLAEVVGEPSARSVASSRSAPASRSFDDDAAHGPLWDSANAVLEEQRRLAQKLARSDDPKRWFTRVYELVTENQLRAIRNKEVHHTAWVLRLIPRFHHYYISNLKRRIGEEPGLPEDHWRFAFDVMHGIRGPKQGPAYVLFHGLLRGIRAHIEEDLPRALAEVYVGHYSGRCDYSRFRADFVLMGQIFQSSSDSLIEQVPRSYLPWYTRWFGEYMPLELTESIRRKKFYNVPQQRLLAFERGERLAAMLTESSPAL